jgi:glycosyltransferase involved in cell wall biosynthesis
MKIILVIPTLTQGGAERVMSELMNIWSKKGHDVHLVLLSKSEKFYKPLSKVNVHELVFNYTNRLNKIYGELRVFFKLRKIIKSQKPTFVLSFMTKYNILTILATLFLPTKIFISDRNNPKTKVPFLISILRKLTYKYADGIISQTSLSIKIMEKETGNKNIAVIPNPVKNVKMFPDIQRENIVLNIGRLIEEKGQKYLVQAFENIEDKEWKLIILGDGPLREELETQINFLGLKERVLMPGTVEDVDIWLAKASIFAFTSISEGFPNVLAEAMAAGLPCVSFDCNTGPREIIQDTKNGFLVPVGDVIKFSSQINLLISEPAVREKLSLEAKKITASLNKHKIADIYLDFCTNKLKQLI